MAAGEWIGFEDGDVEMDFAGAKFNVHRAIMAQASPVWKAVLTGTFAEATGDKVHFDGDDPEVARLCLEMVYSTFADSTLDRTEIESRVMSDRAAFDAFVDKYDLRGVKSLVQRELGVRQEAQCLELKALQAKHLEQEVQQLNRRGTVVDVYVDKPEKGTLVKLHDIAGALDKLVRRTFRRDAPDSEEDEDRTSRQDIKRLRKSIKRCIETYTRVGVVVDRPAEENVSVRWDGSDEELEYDCSGRFEIFELEYA